METLIVILFMPLAVAAERIPDPSHGIWASKTWARNLDCSRFTHAAAHDLYPGRVPEPAGRALGRTEVLACTRRYMSYGERPARDEVILSSLRRTVGEITEVAAAGTPGANVTWHVDAYYPEPHVAQKLSIAAKTDLAERGRRVSDRVPLLAAGDLVVLRDLPPRQAYPMACTRYFQQQVLEEDEALLALVLLDPRETQLHAGVCHRGTWRWLQ